MLKTDVPRANVSSATRNDGRMPIPQQVENLRRELAALNIEKKGIEKQLSDAETWKRSRTADILSKRFPKSRSIELTNRLEADYRERRSPFLVQLHAIEERVYAIKGRLKTAPDKQAADRDERVNREKLQLITLQNIEALLGRVAAKLDA